MSCCLVSCGYYAVSSAFGAMHLAYHDRHLVRRYAGLAFFFRLRYTVRASISEENISNRIDSNRLVLLNRLEVSDDWSKNESPRRHL